MAVRGRFDLHTHSTVSDGTEAPDVVVQQAAIAGLAGLALTDHDSTAGWPAAIAAAREVGIGLLPGIELSTRSGWRSVHMLGYLVDPRDAGLVAETDRIRTSRRDRAHRIVDSIAADYAITWDDVVAKTAPGATVGRPHIADALVALGIEPDRSAAFAGVLHPRRGYVEPHYAPSPAEGVTLIRAAGGVPVLAQTTPGSTVGRPHIADALVANGVERDRSAAFAGVLHPRRGYVEPHYAPTPAAGAALIRAAGGVPVLAHPGATRADWVIPEEEVAELVASGLFGIEADHPENTPDGGRAAARLAARFGLPITGSSDYHGSGKPNRLGDRTTAPEVVDAIIAEGTGSAPVLP